MSPVRKGKDSSEEHKEKDKVSSQNKNNKKTSSALVNGARLVHYYYLFAYLFDLTYVGIKTMELSFN
jgi:hypothetical protein